MYIRARDGGGRYCRVYLAFLNPTAIATLNISKHSIALNGIVPHVDRIACRRCTRLTAQLCSTSICGANPRDARIQRPTRIARKIGVREIHLLRRNRLAMYIRARDGGGRYCRVYLAFLNPLTVATLN